MVNIVIFGIGGMYKVRKHFFEENSDRINIVAYLDNNPAVQGTKIDGITIYAPEKIKEFEYDVVVLMSINFTEEMKEQLLTLGVIQESIWDFKKLRLNTLRGKRTSYGKKKSITFSKEKVLIITTEMDFNGGTLVSVYAAQALQNMGYEVMLSAPWINQRLLAEVVHAGINITVWDCLPYIFPEDYEWIDYYDIVIVNVFQMMNCAHAISKEKPVLWWIHEDRSIWKSFYQDTKKEFPLIDSADWMVRMEVLGVSNVAKEAFNYFYPSVVNRTLPFGIPDRYIREDIKNIPKSKIVFAVSAGYSVYKGQSVLLEAVKKLPDGERKKIELWFIGPNGKNLEELEEICTEKDNIKFLGLLPHDEVIKTLAEIDVLVCPSLIETMSMAVVEGMMFEKLCITTDMTGVAEYIENGKNGFVVRAGDSAQLAECISWIINNQDKWEPIKKAARKTFETEFSLEKFGERLELELKYCKERFDENIINVSASVSQGERE